MMVGRLCYGDEFQMMEFHISKGARDRYQFAGNLFSFTGNVVFASLSACRTFAHRMNQVRDAQKHPERVVHAGALYVMGLIDEASHALIARYREELDPAVMVDALSWFSERVGPEELEKLLLSFVKQFPGTTVYQGIETPQKWLAGSTDGVLHRAAALEEMMLLWMANRNEAFRQFDELFEDKELSVQTAYKRVAESLPAYFATRPLVEVEDSEPQSLYELLLAPAVTAPRSLSEQLDVIRKKWKPLLGASLERFLMIAGEVLHEEELAIWLQFNPETAESRAAAEAAAAAKSAAAAQRRRESGQQQWPSMTSHSEVPEFGDSAHEYENFSPDVDWMPSTVLIAKSTYVWLAQLSKQYGRSIDRLDQIPDEELEQLSRRGLNSLWLIGVWERSRASKTIKQLCGNPDAVASAYSLFDYRIADDLGGESAYVDLRNRAYRHGIRLASDMVPNHMGIDSPWVVEHPDWFISRQDSPYPAYNFDGPDLSQDSRVEIKIENHYFDQTDAAVVFQRRDRQSGETRFIYHGNDGTSFPWNDTAQLDYLNPAVREQLIQTILHVARLFPVIRFDAAMTLAKRHFHRLWFPGPGSSGAIPSRAEYGMSDAEFNAHMPEEFWREVVDRVAVEVPGTLLLAEAFWLMEGYFVRTLGMHRVYNSAFMNMMRDEENAKYRSVLKNTLEFDPDIMKRYVNFMSNPDERTAIDQFGKGDKCFGVAAMMSTLPGLPMFGHGQIEGYTEKYGMEYRRPRYDETADHWLVERHDREIAPLLHQRWLFAESSNFLLYDFFQPDGSVNENVFAYSNRRGDKRGLVLYNNSFSTTRGTIHHSAAYADKGSGQLRQRRLSEGLEMTNDSAVVLRFRDSLTGLEYLQRASKIANEGFGIELNGYKCHIFLDWRELRASFEKPWDRLCDQLNGTGVPNLDDALVNLELRPVHDALRELLEPSLVRMLADLTELPRAATGIEKKHYELQKNAFFELAWNRSYEFLRRARVAYGQRAGHVEGFKPASLDSLATEFRERLRAAMRIPGLESYFAAPWSAGARRVLPSRSPQLTATAMWGPVLSWCVLELLAESIDEKHPERAAVDVFDRLRLRQPLGTAFAALGFEAEENWRVAARIKVALLVGSGVLTEDEKPVAEKAEATPGPSPTKPDDPPILSPENSDSSSILSPVLWKDPDVQWLTGVHKADGIEYFLKESYEDLLWWLQLPCLFTLGAQASPDRAKVAQMTKTVIEAREAAGKAGYRVDVFLGQDEPKQDAEKVLLPGRGETVIPATESEPAKKIELEQAATATVGLLELAGEKLKDQ
jgi:glycosidase